MILVTGATGGIGRALVDQLKAQGATFRAGVRDPEKAKSLEQEGVEVVQADFGSPDQLREAMSGVKAVFLVSAQHPQQTELQNNVADAASESGVERIVKVSAGSSITASDSPSWVGRAHWETEEHIKASGVDYTFLRPNWFMKNLVTMADPIRTGVLPVPVHDQRTGLVDHRDIAAVAAVALAGNGQHSGQVYDITGPEALPFSDVAQRIGKVLNREIKYVDPPIDAAIENLRSKGAPDWLQDHMRQVMTAVSEGKFDQATNTVERVTGRAPRSIEDFVRDHRAVFDGGPA